MANVITGKVHEIMAPRAYDKKDGTKGWTQEIVVDAAQTRNGETYENFPSVEINDGIDGNMIALVQIGAMLSFSFEVRGRYYQDKQTGERRHINTIRCYKVEQAVIEQRAPKAVAQPLAPTAAQGMPNSAQGASMPAANAAGTAAGTAAQQAQPQQRQQYAQPTVGFFNQQQQAPSANDDYPFPMV